MGVLGADAANSEGRKINGYGADYDNSVVRDVGQLTVVPAIAWKRRANQQEIHQLSIKPLSASNVIESALPFTSQFKFLFSSEESCWMEALEIH